MVKIYAAILDCFDIKAVHIKIVSDLSTEASLACLKSLFGAWTDVFSPRAKTHASALRNKIYLLLSRRVRSFDRFSNNATYFKGVKRELAELCQFLNNEENINNIFRNFSNYAGINWHLILARSPHCGRLWDSAVKSFKHNFTRIIGEKILTYKELTTFTTKVEGIENSRSSTPIPSGRNDLVALTPSHLFIDDSITNVLENNLMNVPPNQLSSWQKIQ